MPVFVILSVLCIDVSGSMTYKGDAKPSKYPFTADRYGAVKEACVDFIKWRKTLPSAEKDLFTVAYHNTRLHTGIVEQNADHTLAHLNAAICQGGGNNFNQVRLVFAWFFAHLTILIL